MQTKLTMAPVSQYRTLILLTNAHTRRVDALQWLQPTVNDTKKLIAYIFNGRSIQDGAKRNTLGSVPTSARLSNQVENSTTRRKVSQ